MAETPSTMIPLGSPASHFELLDARSGKKLNLQSLKSDKATIIMFICNHCPYVIHILPELLKLIRDYQAHGLSFIAINSNDIKNYPADSPEKMHEIAIEKNFTFPYLFDEIQEVARAYQAACTPDIYIFDNHLKCVYRGRFDDSTPGNGRPVTGKDLRAALDAILNGKAVEWDQKPSVGCNIKWKK